MSTPDLSDRLNLGEAIPHDQNAQHVLSFGVTNFPPPEHFEDAVKTISEIIDDESDSSDAVGLSSKEIHKYIDESGLSELKRQIQEKWLYSASMKRPIQSSINGDGDPGIIITCGGQSAVYTAVGSLLDNNEKLMVFSPYYPYHHNAAILHTTRTDSVSVVETEAEHNFTPDIEEVRNRIKSENIKAIALCNPCNPTGQIYSEEFLEQLAELCVENDVYVISDEVYSFLTYSEEKFRSISTFPGMAERTIVIGSFSKLLGITGWRLGFMVAPEHLYDSLVMFNDHINIHPPTHSQAVLAEALSSVDSFSHTKEWRKELKERRDIIAEPFKKWERTKVADPEGAFYLMPRISDDLAGTFRGTRYEKEVKRGLEDTGVDRDPTLGECFKEYLKEEADVQVMQGIAFGESASNNIRIAFGSTGKEDLHKAAENIERSLAKLDSI